MRIIIILTILFWNVLAYPQEDFTKDFVNAFEAYNTGNYSKSIELYGKILRNKPGNAAIHYNLANSYFRNGKLGPSIFHFRKALKYSPRDADIIYNIKYARAKAVDKIEKNFSLINVFFIPVTIYEGLFLIFICSLLFWIPQIVLMFKNYVFLKWIRNISLFFLIYSVSLFYQTNNLRTKFGVVTQEKIDVYSAIGKDNIRLFTLHEGAEFDLLDQVNEKWILIQLSDGKKGWIRKKGVML